MTEIWKPVVGHPNYEVSNRGRVRSLDRIVPRSRNGGSVVCDMKWKGRTLKDARGTNGHRLVGLGTKNGRGPNIMREVHRLVLLAFAGSPPPGYEGRHINGDPSDNCWPENLEWSTRSQNLLDRKWHDGVRGRLTVGQIRGIKAALKVACWGEHPQIAARFGVNRATVQAIASGTRHAEV